MEYLQRVAKFDVIIPAYNAQAYLPAAIESVMAQDLDDWRVVLVNDGSTDATAEVADTYQRQLGSKMHVITQENAGMSAARNVAMQASSAEFVAFLDADDIWLPSRLRATAQAFASRPNAALSYGLIARVDETGRVLSTFAGNPRYAEGRIAPSIYKRQVELPCVTVSLRRSALESVGYFDESMRATEDRDLWLRIALRYEVAFVPQVIAQYRMSANSASANLDRMTDGQLRFIDKHFGSPGCGRLARRIARARVWKQRGELFSERGQRWSAVGNALRACSIWPLGSDNLRTAASLFLRSVRSR